MLGAPSFFASSACCTWKTSRLLSSSLAADDTWWKSSGKSSCEILHRSGHTHTPTHTHTHTHTKIKEASPKIKEASPKIKEASPKNKEADLTLILQMPNMDESRQGESGDGWRVPWAHAFQGRNPPLDRCQHIGVPSIGYGLHSITKDADSKKAPCGHRIPRGSLYRNLHSTTGS